MIPMSIPLMGIDGEHMVEKDLQGVRALWSFRDVLVVSVAILCIFLLSVIGLNALVSERIAMFCSVSISYLAILLLPIWRIKKCYGVGKEALGLKKGKWSPMISIVIGGISGLIFMLLQQYVEQCIIGGTLVPLDRPGAMRLVKEIVSSLSPVGALFYLLVSVAEEGFFRGFIYGYARGVMGITWGLICQALLFGVLHWGYLGPTVFLKVYYVCVGLLLGILYQRSDSVIPGAACHWVMNITARAFGGIPLT
jgi:membrane protease YdiL (CAAX protease family)